MDQVVSIDNLEVRESLWTIWGSDSLNKRAGWPGGLNDEVDDQGVNMDELDGQEVDMDELKTRISIWTS